MPKRAPWSHTASATGATIARVSLGRGVGREVEVGTVEVAAEQQVADDPADEVEPVPGVGEALGQRPALLEDGAHPVGDHGRPPYE